MSWEKRDVSVRAIAVFAGALVASAVVIHIAVWLTILFFQRGTPDRPKLAPREPAVPPLEIQDAARQRQAEEAILSSEGNGRIPIERAMDLVVDELPVRKEKK